MLVKVYDRIFNLFSIREYLLGFCNVRGCHRTYYDEVMPHTENPLTYLMPAYSLTSYVLLFRNTESGAWMLPVSGFGLGWAGLNTVRLQMAKSKIKLDLGLVTFGFVALLSSLERSETVTFGTLKWPMVLGCLLVMANYGFAVATGMAKKMVKKKLKSPLWGTIFTAYCSAQTMFWLGAAYFTMNRSA